MGIHLMISNGDGHDGAIRVELREPASVWDDLTNFMNSKRLKKIVVVVVVGHPRKKTPVDNNCF
jgi:hypothetical protein